MWKIIAACFGFVVIGVVLYDIKLTLFSEGKRRTKLWFTWSFSRALWSVWSSVIRSLPRGELRNCLAIIFIPCVLTLIVVFWGAGFIAGFTALHYAAGSRLAILNDANGFLTYLYTSSATFCPLAASNVEPHTKIVSLLVIVETSVGMGFTLCVLAFAIAAHRVATRQHKHMKRIEDRIGKPDVLTVFAPPQNESLCELTETLALWEQEAIELHNTLSRYPLLGYLSGGIKGSEWLYAMTAVMDVCVIVIASTDSAISAQAKSTFGAARRVVRDFAEQVGNLQMIITIEHRGLPASLRKMLDEMAESSVQVKNFNASAEQLFIWRETYEPYVCLLSEYLYSQKPIWTNNK